MAAKQGGNKRRRGRSPDRVAVRAEGPEGVGVAPGLVPAERAQAPIRDLRRHRASLVVDLIDPDLQLFLRGRSSSTTREGSFLRSEVNSELNFPPNFEGLVLGCIDADFCK